MTWWQRRVFGVDRTVLDSRTLTVDLDRLALSDGVRQLTAGAPRSAVLALLGAPDSRALMRQGVLAYARAGLVVELDGGVDGLSVSLCEQGWYRPLPVTPFQGQVRWRGALRWPGDIREAEVRGAAPGAEVDRDDDETVISTRPPGGAGLEWEFLPGGRLKYVGVFAG